MMMMTRCGSHASTPAPIVRDIAVVDLYDRASHARSSRSTSWSTTRSAARCRAAERSRDVAVSARARGRGGCRAMRARRRRHRPPAPGRAGGCARGEVEQIARVGRGAGGEVAGTELDADRGDRHRQAREDASVTAMLGSDVHRAYVEELARRAEARKIASLGIGRVLETAERLMVEEALEHPDWTAGMVIVEREHVEAVAKRLTERGIGRADRDPVEDLAAGGDHVVRVGVAWSLLERHLRCGCDAHHGQ
jgi:hypothetical protein